MTRWTGLLAIVGLAVVLQPDPARSQDLPRTPPPAPSDLTATAFSYGRIDLTWRDDSANKRGFRIERRARENGPWVVIDSIGADTTAYTDGSLSLHPETEYCYRLVAFNGAGDSGYSSETCATTLAVPAIGCRADEHDSRSGLERILTSAEAYLVEWRAKVGLSSVNPDFLLLVSDDSVCDSVWTALNSEPPDNKYNELFTFTVFKIAGVYVFREIIIDQWTMGKNATAVVTTQFEPVYPILMD